MKKSKRKDQQSFKQTEYRDYKRVRILKKPIGNLRKPKRNQLKGNESPTQEKLLFKIELQLTSMAIAYT